MIEFTDSFEDLKEIVSLIQDQNVVGIILFQDDRVIFFNDLLSINSQFSNEELMKMTPSEIVRYTIHPEDATFVGEQMQKKIRGDTDVIEHYQLRIIDKSKKSHWVNSYSRTVIYKGKPADLIVFVDINDLKKIEHAIQAISDSIMTITGQSFFNSAVQKLCEILEADHCLIGELVKDNTAIETISYFGDGRFLQPVFYDLDGTPSKNIVTGGFSCYPQKVSQFFPKDQSLQDYDVEGYAGIPLFDSANNPQGVLILMYRYAIQEIPIIEKVLKVFAKRISLELERLSYAKLLAQSEEELRAFTDHFSNQEVIGVMAWKNNKLTFSNKAIEKISGYKLNAETSFGFREAFQMLIHPDDHEDVMSQMLNAKNKTITFECRIIRKDASIGWIRVFFFHSSIMGEETDLVYAIDITSEKHKDEMLSHQTKLAAIGEMAAGFAHEINQPITALKSNAEYLKELVDRDQMDKETFEKSLSTMIRLSDKMAMLINEIRAFSRKKTTHYRNLLLSEVMQETLDLYKMKFDHLKITLFFDIFSEAQVKGNAEQLQQVFLNLIDNAIDALEDITKKFLVITVEKTESTVMLNFSDNGIGISEELKQKMFIPFVTTKKKGTGLGLSISYNIIKEHGADIEVISEEGVGTHFIISFKVDPPLIS